MFCPSCGTEQTQNFPVPKFCWKCGSTLSSIENKKSTVATVNFSAFKRKKELDRQTSYQNRKQAVFV
jgi:hypothetical protein